MEMHDLETLTTHGLPVFARLEQIMHQFKSRMANLDDMAGAETFTPRQRNLEARQPEHPRHVVLKIVQEIVMIHRQLVDTTIECLHLVVAWKQNMESITPSQQQVTMTNDRTALLLEAGDLAHNATSVVLDKCRHMIDQLDKEEKVLRFEDVLSTSVIQPFEQLSFLPE